MIILALILILAGSFAGAFLLWLQDASFWMIVLGYVGGGWAGLLAGMPVVLATCRWRTVSPCGTSQGMATDMENAAPQPCPEMPRQ